MPNTPQSLNAYLASRSYIQGHSYTAEDDRVLREVQCQPGQPSPNLVHFNRWSRHVKYLQLQLQVYFQGSNMAKPNEEQTYIMVKPDGVQRGLVGDIIHRFEKRGYQLCALKMRTASKELLEEHYGDLKKKPFFPGLVNFMSSGPVVSMVWQGKDAVKQGRAMLGETNPLASKAGSIRGDYCIDMGRNICHGSDSVESANKEIKMWFGEGEVQKYSMTSDAHIYE